MAASSGLVANCASAGPWNQIALISPPAAVVVGAIGGGCGGSRPPGRGNVVEQSDFSTRRTNGAVCRCADRFFSLRKLQRDTVALPRFQHYFNDNLVRFPATQFLAWAPLDEIGEVAILNTQHYMQSTVSLLPLTIRTLLLPPFWRTLHLSLWKGWVCVSPFPSSKSKNSIGYGYKFHLLVNTQ